MSYEINRTHSGVKSLRHHAYPVHGTSSRWYWQNYTSESVWFAIVAEAEKIKFFPWDAPTSSRLTPVHPTIIVRVITFFIRLLELGPNVFLNGRTRENTVFPSPRAWRRKRLHEGKVQSQEQPSSTFLDEADSEIDTQKSDINTLQTT